MAIKRTQSGKVDKRTKEYKEMCTNLAKARKDKKAKEKKVAAKRTSSGKIDKRTKEYKEMCANLAKARKKKKSLSNRIKKLLK